jgi:hypothetical protein
MGGRYFYAIITRDTPGALPAHRTVVAQPGTSPVRRAGRLGIENPTASCGSPRAAPQRHRPDGHTLCLRVANSPSTSISRDQ